jgi:hypothetical protein
VQLLFSTRSFVPLSSLERRVMVGFLGTGKDDVVALPDQQQASRAAQKKGMVGRTEEAGRDELPRIERSPASLTPHD